MRSRPFPLVAVPVLVALAVIAGAQSPDPPLFETGFEDDPVAQGWSSSTPIGPEGNGWADEDAHTGMHSLRVVDGAWVSPPLVVEGGSFYEVAAHARAHGAGRFGTSRKAAMPYDPSGSWAARRFALRVETDADDLRVVLRSAGDDPAYVDDVVVRRIGRDEAAEIGDGIWAAIAGPRLATDRRTVSGLPRFRRLLARGGDVRIVMLGDSVVDDTSSSNFELLLERTHPGADVEIVTSTRNSTGAWWYREVDEDTGIPRVRTWVTDHRPDLVVFGGISHGQEGLEYEIDSIRDVVRQVRAILPRAEFAVMSELAGRNDPAERPWIADPFDPDGSDWRARLHRLAVEERLAFFDGTRPWAGFVLEAGLAHDDLMRDELHANVYGAQLAGRILATYLLGSHDADPSDGFEREPRRPRLRRAPAIAR